MGKKCPTCGRDDFSSEKGMRSHHKIMHGESLKKTVTCKNCGENFDVLPYRVENENVKFCSSDCQYSFQKNRVEKICEVCGSVFETRKSEDYSCCSWECRNKNLEQRTEHCCEWCGDTFDCPDSEERKFCSVECTENWFSSKERPTSNGTGEKHWAYIDGGGSRWYGPNWRNKREEANSRVDECEHPDCTNSEDLQCHHIVPFRYFVREDSVNYQKANNTDNLMMLCPKHHTKLDWKMRRLGKITD